MLSANILTFQCWVNVFRDSLCARVHQMIKFSATKCAFAACATTELQNMPSNNVSCECVCVCMCEWVGECICKEFWITSLSATIQRIPSFGVWRSLVQKKGEQAHIFPNDDDSGITFLICIFNSWYGEKFHRSRQLMQNSLSS
jgi:hypothetical protein